MALSPVTLDNEKNKFAETSGGKAAVRTIGSEELGSFDLSASIGEWPLLAVGNRVEATYPNATTEVYTFKEGATTVAVLEVGYTDLTKSVFSYAERTA